MNILAIDTSESACSVALLHGNQVISRHHIAPQQHTQFILPFIQELLSEANITLSQLNALAFGKGPGSFTGLRIAAGITQGLAYAANLPVVPISTLRALAQNAYRQYNTPFVFPALDARMDQIYFGEYQLDSHQIMRPLIEDTVLEPKDIEKVIIDSKTNHQTGIGSGWKVHESILKEKLIGIDAIYPETFVEAEDIAKLAATEFEKGNVVSAEQAIPVYLRGFNG